MTRRQKRKIIIIVLLLILLTVIGLYFAYFNATKRLDFDFDVQTGELLPAPEYLYSFSGPEGDPMMRPIGLDVVGEEVYVTDSRRQKVYVFDLDGEFLRSFGEEELAVPLYVAENPLDGNIYVSDRRQRTVFIFEPDGTFVSEFDPKLPEDQLPAFETNGVQWAPVALAFGPDGTMYFTEILNGHRLLIFSPEGEFQRAVGTVGIVNNAEQGEEFFQFPNSVKFYDESVWVADSNNRRIQIFSPEGDFERIIVTNGLPRGFDFLQRSDEASATDKFVVVDTLAHDATIWSADGEKIVNFGERGVLEGQFNYPNDLSVGSRNLIFIADSANGRVQVWGWPEEVSPVPLPQIVPYWRWCFAPLLLLPLLLLFRKKRFFATADFVEMMLEIDETTQMPHRRRRWLVTETDYEKLKGFTQGEVDMAELLNPSEFSDSDVKALMDKLEIEREPAIVMAIAQRAHVFCTEDDELRRIARVLEIDVVNHKEFLERFSKKGKGSAEPTGPVGEK